MSVEDNQLPYIGDDRRVRSKDRRDCPHALENARLFREGAARMDRIEATLAETAKNLAENTQATKEGLEIVQMGKGFFRTTKFLGDAFKWAAGIALAAIAAWHAWKDGL